MGAKTQKTTKYAESINLNLLLFSILLKIYFTAFLELNS
jgi:hypothetical protein